jgi:hypothetical protein
VPLADRTISGWKPGRDADGKKQTCKPKLHAPHAISAKTLLAHWFREKRSTLFEVVLGNNALPIEEPMHKAIKSIPLIDDEAVYQLTMAEEKGSYIFVNGSLFYLKPIRFVLPFLALFLSFGRPCVEHNTTIATCQEGTTIRREKHKQQNKRHG